MSAKAEGVSSLVRRATDSASPSGGAASSTDTQDRPEGAQRPLRFEGPEYMSADEIARITNERDRYRTALEKILSRHRRRSQSWRMPDDEQWATRGPGSRHWSDGFLTGLATVCEEAHAALTPLEHFESNEQWRAASRATDVEWFRLTGCCGHCGAIASRCVCPPSDPCACGPHEMEPWPRVCGTCDGTGLRPIPAWWDAEGRP